MGFHNLKSAVYCVRYYIRYSMSNFAVIETGGKQYTVSDGDRITVELLKDSGEGDTVSFDKVLLFDDGTKTDIGTPYLSDKKVAGVLEKVGRHKKISVIRFRAKSNHRRHYGHRQSFCTVRITEVS